MALDPIGTPRRSASLASSALNGAFSRVPSNSLFSNGNSVNNDDVDNAHISQMWDRYAQIKNVEGIKNSFIEELITRYAYLEKTHSTYVQASELERLRSTPNSEGEAIWQDKCEQMLAMLNREPFMLVLIDGDGMIFSDKLLRLGEAGGKKAAHQLKHAVHDWARTKLQDCPTEFKVVTRIYANVKGLAETCRRAGIVSTTDVILDFVRGFTSDNALFDFTDVGPGKDRADMKIIEHFKLHIPYYQCRHIFFGCSHDNGFARLLGQYTFDSEVRSRVTLLEGVPFEKELAMLDYNKVKFGQDLFRSSKINLNPPDLLTDFPRFRQDSKNTGFNPASGIFTPSQTPGTPLFSPRSGPPRPASPATSLSFRGTMSRTNSIASSMAEAPAGNNGSAGGAWANIARSSAHLPFKDLAKPAPEVKPAAPIIRQNKEGKRIDVHMDYNHERVFELKKIKLCNQHYIGKGCCHWDSGNGNCPHMHDMNLSNEDKKWLRVVARETVCKKGTSCTDFDCIYGHHCPYPKAQEGSMRGIGCINGEKCRFAYDMHGMDMTVARVVRPQDV